MQGNDNDQGSADGRPPEETAGRIERLLIDAGDVRVQRLSALVARLQSDEFRWEHSALAREISTLNSAAREFQLRKLRQGWFARLLGRHRAPALRCAAAHERIVARASSLAAQAASMAAAFTSHNEGAKRLLAELESESRALQRDLDRGVTWLQDMCAQLAHLRIDDHPKLVSLLEAAEKYTRHFKWLQAMVVLAADIGVRGNSIVGRRAALLERVRSDADGFDKSWKRASAPVVAALNEGRTPGSLAEAAAAHEDLTKRLEAAADACSALVDEEHMLAQQLAQLRLDAQSQA